MRSLPALQSCPRILVRGVNWLGDAVMSTPALVRLREAAPGAEITLLTPAKLEDLWQSHPAIDRVLTFHPTDSLFSVGRSLRQHNFSLGLILPNSFRSAAEATWARIPHRIGYRGQHRRWLLTHAVAPRPGAVHMHKRTDREIRQRVENTQPTAGHARERNGAGVHAAVAEPTQAHHLHQYLHLVQALGANPAPLAPALYVSDQESADFVSRAGLRRAGDPPLCGVNAGAEYGPAKRWPVERFAAAAAEIAARSRCSWVILGGRGDVDLAEGLATRLRAAHPKEPAAVVNLAGATSLRELCVVLKACRLLLTNDTGPMHVAAALGTPVIALFGSTSSELTGPGLPGDPVHRILRANVPCAPCFRRECPIDFRCMRQISEAEVVRAALQVLGAA